jgi:menaquinone-dependent protoporphyrinogen IX oxidase
MTDNPAYRSHVFKDANALVVYASTHGHTAKIAARIAAAVRDEGLEVDLRDVADAAAARPGRYDVVVIGASLHKERHQKEIVHWVTEHRAALAQLPTGRMRSHIAIVASSSARSATLRNSV